MVSRFLTSTGSPRRARGEPRTGVELGLVGARVVEQILDQLLLGAREGHDADRARALRRIAQPREHLGDDRLGLDAVLPGAARS